jgi:hypothetical protein
MIRTRRPGGGHLGRWWGQGRQQCLHTDGLKQVKPDHHPVRPTLAAEVLQMARLGRPPGEPKPLGILGPRPL